MTVIDSSRSCFSINIKSSTAHATGDSSDPNPLSQRSPWRRSRFLKSSGVVVPWISKSNRKANGPRSSTLPHTAKPIMVSRSHSVQEEDIMKKRVLTFLTDEAGQDVVEYSLLLVLIGTVVLVYITGLGMNLSNVLQKISTRMSQASGLIP
jgi:Flp pilus assembly pilin Flp